MDYEKFILPGNRGWNVITGASDILLQDLGEGGVMLHEFSKGKLVREVILEELSGSQKEETPAYIGEAEGADFFHCFFIGCRHSPGFAARVTAFRRTRPTFFFTKVRVLFYGVS